MKHSKKYAAQIAVVAVYAIFLCLLWRTPLPINMQNTMYLYMQTTESSAHTADQPSPKASEVYAVQRQSLLSERETMRRAMQKSAVPYNFALRNVILGLAGAISALVIQQTARRPNCRIKHAE